MTNKKSEHEENEALQTTEKASMSERYTQMVLKEFGSNVTGAIQVSDYQKHLIQGYFIGIDRALKMAESNRLSKNTNNKDHKYDNDLPCTWNNVNLMDLALDTVHFARMGLDMMEDNHLSPIPYKNSKTQKYDVTLIPGYNGIEYIAEKYAIDKPLNVTIELVYSTDKFKPIKKSKDNKVESYEFEIVTPFQRGNVVGGFGYIKYEDATKNKLVIMTLQDIQKRKPKYAATEFWGGKTKVWENGKQVEQESDGWFEEMCLKTIKREVYSAKHMPRDPQKVDDNYQYMKMREIQYTDEMVQNEIDNNANKIFIEGTPVKVEDGPEENQIIETPKNSERQPAEDKKSEVNVKKANEQQEQIPMDGPGF